MDMTQPSVVNTNDVMHVDVVFLLLEQLENWVDQLF